MLRHAQVIALAVVTAASGRVALGQFFSDDMSSGANWSIVQDADSSVEFAYDYSLKGIPPAPSGDGDTIGLKFEVNNNAPAEVNEIAAFNSNAAYTGQYTLRADVWINWALVGGTAGAGTTEFAGLSVGHDGLDAGPSAATFIFDGDGDTTADYRLYKDVTLQDPASGQYATGNVAGANGNTNPTYTAAFPAINVATSVPAQGQTGTSPAGAGGFQWMTVNVEVDTDAVGPAGVNANPGYTRVSLRSASSGNTVVVGTIDNSNSGAVVNMSGTIALLMSDIFSSVTINPAFSFAIFDNVRVFDGLAPLNPVDLPGDYNDDGSVDAADYVVWRKNDGTSNTLPNNGDLPGPIGTAHYNLWRTNFGQSIDDGARPDTAVPEPAALALLLIGATGTFARWRAR
jgi:hypothetical protein